MKIRSRHKVAPIFLAPCDTLTLTYNENGKSRHLLTETVGRTMKVNEVVVFDLNDKECAKLGWNDGIGGAFGERSDYKKS